MTLVWVKRIDIYDVLVVLGVVALEYGISRWSVAGAWVVGGLVLIGLGISADVVRKGKR